LFEDIRKVFKNVHINIPFLTVIQQVPAYSKFLKDLCTIKRTTQVRRDAFIATFVLNSGGVIKCGDPRTPLVSCKIDDNCTTKALIDLGAL